MCELVCCLSQELQYSRHQIAMSTGEREGGEGEAFCFVTVSQPDKTGSFFWVGLGETEL